MISNCYEVFLNAAPDRCRNKRPHTRCPVSGGGGGLIVGWTDQSRAPVSSRAPPPSSAAPPPSPSCCERTVHSSHFGRLQLRNGTLKRNQPKTRRIHTSHDTSQGHVRLVFLSSSCHSLKLNSSLPFKLGSNWILTFPLKYGNRHGVKGCSRGSWAK